MNFQFYIPTRVVFGTGSFNKLGMMDMPGKKALIVISSGGSMQRLGYLETLLKQLCAMKIRYSIFSGIKPNPTKKSVMEGASLARSERCDFIIALGGGSTIDAAKAISVMAVNPGDYWDYVRAGSGKGRPVLTRPLPVVTISTTSGTGSETDPWSVITNEELCEKVGFGCDQMYPVLSVFDPMLTMSVPARTTAYQGFDALFHCAEGLLNRETSDVADMFAMTGLRLIGENLPKAVKNGNDLNARTAMAEANMLAGFVQCLANSTAAHAMEHAMSALKPDLSHGAGLIMIAKEYYTLIAQQGGRDKTMISMAQALGEEKANDPMDFVHRLNELIEICNVSELKMSDYGITSECLTDLFNKARKEMPHMFANEPADIPDEEYIRVLIKSWK